MRNTSLAIDHADPLPLHIKVERLLRALAAKREYQNGRRSLPPEISLARKLGVSRATVRQAMQRLVHEGLLIRKRNAGTRVAERRLTTQLADWSSFTAEMSRHGVLLQSLRTRARFAPAPTEVASFFRIPRGRRCLRLIRLKGQDGLPIAEFRSWLHPRLGLIESDDFSLPLYQLIEARSQVVVARSREVIGAISAGLSLSAELACDVGQPVLTRRRRVSDVGDKPVEYCECFYRADLFSYSVDILRGKGVQQP